MQRKFSSLAADTLWYSPLYIAFLLTFTCIGDTALDSGLYLKKAYEFTQGQFDWGFRPGFIFLLGSAFSILGPTIWSATVVIRIFFFANVMVVFFLTRYLYNKRAAFAASFTLIFSYYLTFLSHRVLLDNAQPFFILLAVFITVYAIDRRSDKLAITAGLIFVYAYLVKSTTLLFVPLPLVLVISYSGIHLNFSKLRQAFIICGIAGGGIAIYNCLLYLLNRSSSAEHSFGAASADAGALLTSGNLIEILQNLLQGFLGFLDQFLFQDIWLGWIFVMAWLWIAVKSIRHRQSRAIIAVFFLFLPSMIYLGLSNYRLGQASTFLFITFVPLGVLIQDLSKAILLIAKLSKNQDTWKINSASGIIVIGIAASLSVYQFWYIKDTSKKSATWLQHTYLGRLFQDKATTWTLTGNFDLQSKRAAEKIIKYAGRHKKIRTGFLNCYAIDFFTNYQFETSRFETGIIKAKSLGKKIHDQLPKGTIVGKLIFLWPNCWERRLEYYNTAGEFRIRYIDENMLARQLTDDNLPMFIPLDKRYYHLGDYFETIPGAVKLLSRPLVFRIDKFQLIEDYKPRVAYEISMLLNELRSRSPENYSILRNNFFPRFFKFTPEQVDAIANLDQKAAGVVFIGYPGRKYPQIKN